MPFIRQETYRNLLTHEARCQWLEAENADLRQQLVAERLRAEHAIDSMLIRHDALPISVPKPALPEQAMFEDDPAELATMMKEFQAAPVEVLMNTGRGDAA